MEGYVIPIYKFIELISRKDVHRKHDGERRGGSRDDVTRLILVPR